MQSFGRNPSAVNMLGYFTLRKCFKLISMFYREKAWVSSQNVHLQLINCFVTQQCMRTERVRERRGEGKQLKMCPYVDCGLCVFGRLRGWASILSCAPFIKFHMGYYLYWFCLILIVGSKNGAKYKNLENWSCAIGYGVGSGSPLSPSFNFGLELAKSSQVWCIFFFLWCVKISCVLIFLTAAKPRFSFVAIDIWACISKLIFGWKRRILREVLWARLLHLLVMHLPLS